MDHLTMRPLLFLMALATSSAALPSTGSRIPSAALIPKRGYQPAARQLPADFNADANKLIPVVVGGPQDTFVPNSVSADIGDIVQFQFSNGNHTVTQSAQDTPCQPLDGGIHSGHIPYVAEQADVGTFNMPVTSTDPLFLYCATGPHCLEGQVMVVNPADVEQVVNYSKTAQGQEANVDASEVRGGTVGSIPLAQAAFVPAAEEEQGPPAEAGGETENPAEGEASSSTLSGTTTTTITVDPTAVVAPTEAAAASALLGWIGDQFGA